jgi:hypothetical protein
LIQPKLAISKPSDKYEREADRAAEIVIRMPTPRVGRKARFSNKKQTAVNVPPVVYGVLQSAGQPLDANTRTYMERRFGYDLGQVRIHTDHQADDSSRVVNALAYTVGENIVFGRGQYAPRTVKGRKLLSHELMHTVQQCSDGKAWRSRLRMSGLTDIAEQTSESTDRDTIQRKSPGAESSSSNSQIWRSDFDIEIYPGPSDEGFVNKVREHLNRIYARDIGKQLLSSLEDTYIKIHKTTGGCAAQPAPNGYFVFYNTRCPISVSCKKGDPNWRDVPNYVYLFHEFVHVYLFTLGYKDLRLHECLATGLGFYFEPFGIRLPNENRFRCDLGLPPRPCNRFCKDGGELYEEFRSCGQLLKRTWKETGSRHKVSPDFEKIRSGLSGWFVTEKDIHNVLLEFKGLNDQDLKDTLIELDRENLTDKIFEKSGDKDKKEQAALLDRIRRLQFEKTLLFQVPQAKGTICKVPPKGPWEIASLGNDLSVLNSALWLMSALMPPHMRPVRLRKLGILAHGDKPGQIQIGNALVTHENVRNYEGMFGELKQYLTSDADIYLFGCISGQGREGSALLVKLSLFFRGRRIIAFNVLTKLDMQAGIQGVPPGEFCLWPAIGTTAYKAMVPDEIWAQWGKSIKTMAPATIAAPSSKVAKDGEIILWPIDEIFQKPQKEKRQ